MDVSRLPCRADVSSAKCVQTTTFARHAWRRIATLDMSSKKCQNAELLAMCVQCGNQQFTAMDVMHTLWKKRTATNARSVKTTTCARTASAPGSISIPSMTVGFIRAHKLQKLLLPTPRAWTRRPALPPWHPCCSTAIQKCGQPPTTLWQVPEPQAMPPRRCRRTQTSVMAGRGWTISTRFLRRRTLCQTSMMAGTGWTTWIKPLQRSSMPVSSPTPQLRTP
mmetsp:Transcript_22588/g.53269  ORF Transcript_22588/g.53269 Transcript_22588/m.53269 type:complete len:222 (-) Transcript_22588:556-1221(-)